MVKKLSDKWQNQDWTLGEVGVLFKNTHVLTHNSRGGIYLPNPLILGLGYVTCFGPMVGGMYFTARGL